MKKFILILIIALAFFACDDDNGTETHTHDYGTEWKSNETQHWRECSCGDKTDVADHDWGKWQEKTPPTITTEGEETRTCNTCEKTETQSIAKLQEYTYSYPAVNLPSPTLSDGTTTWNSADGFNGVVNASSYTPWAEITITQVFVKDGKEIGRKVIKIASGGSTFVVMADDNDDAIRQIPDVKLAY
jgi:hypothetical protein